jgi:hypothetical protein
LHSSNNSTFIYTGEHLILHKREPVILVSDAHKYNNLFKEKSSPRGGDFSFAGANLIASPRICVIM